MKIRLIILNFFQFFAWGSWLITIGNYWFATRQWPGTEFGIIFSTMGISSLFMPALAGMIADRWVNAERLYGVLHVLSGACLFLLPQCNSPSAFFWVILAAMIFYMPTIALAIAINYSVLKAAGRDVVKDYPPIRVFGTFGFIVAMWTTNLTGSKASANQFIIAGAVSVLLGLYAFTMPKCPPLGRAVERKSWVQILGLDAFALFKQRKMALFFLFSMCLGAACQLSNAYGDVFLSDFGGNPAFGPDNFVVRYSTIIMSISQMSELLFILAIPFALKKFGIKNVMLASMVAWVLRFGLFAFGDPAGGLWMLILSCIVYGVAFDFFNISGSLFVETATKPDIRASAQGLFMMMTNGFGAVLGSSISGMVIQRCFTAADGVTKDWHGIWLAFSAYALVVAVLFAVFFRHDATPDAAESGK
jgi:NHS family xanthosine MFS transporter